jgi:hypothetical protein
MGWDKMGCDGCPCCWGIDGRPPSRVRVRLHVCVCVSLHTPVLVHACQRLEGHAPPRHGTCGAGDRGQQHSMQVVMAAFSYIYFNTYVARSTATMAAVLSSAMKLNSTQQVSGQRGLHVCVAVWGGGWGGERLTSNSYVAKHFHCPVGAPGASQQHAGG